MPERKLSRCFSTYAALMAVYGVAGMYITTESSLPVCCCSTAWIPSCVFSLN